MTDPDATRIGRVRHVLGSTVTVSLDAELAGVSPIYRGQLQPIGQIGSLVRIPQGMIDLVASVSQVGIAEALSGAEWSSPTQEDKRWLEVKLLGEIDRGTGRFQRGVGSYPGIDDSVHFTTPEQLAAVFPPASDQHVRIGYLAAAEGVAVCLDASRLVVRHAAVVGSTGSGKTSAVASLLQAFANGGWPAANIVVIDPHGEYASALQNVASVRSVLPDSSDQLRVPYWALPARDIRRVFIGSDGGPTFQARMDALIGEARRDFVERATWLTLDPAAVTPDTPVPFDIRPIWLQIDRENRETLMDKADPTTACETDPGDADELRPAEFEPYGPGGQAPHKGQFHGSHGSMPDMLRLGLTDPRLSFFQEPMGIHEGDDPLIEVVQQWLGGDKPVSVLDFSSVPADAADLAIGVVLSLLFELATRSEFEEPGIGRPAPVLIVLEEAHRYLGEGASALTRASANRIAREGRKYGIGLVLVTQRPSELPKTALAQVGTLIALRLSNAEDQGVVRSALPDTVAGLASVLSSLRTGEAIVSGEAVVLPARILIDRPQPPPSAEDPSLEPWRGEPAVPEVAAGLALWRNAYDTTDD